jgi:predicted acetyltransferase
MDLELRTIRDDEFAAFLRASSAAFGMSSDAGDDDYSVQLLPPDRAIAVFDEGAIVATAAAHTFRITVPGGARVDAAGVSSVGVLPTHRRRGLLRRMMGEQLDDVTRRGEPLALLTASEASIYERFGYGIGTFSTRFELASEHARLATPPSAPGRVRIVEGDAAVAASKAVYDVAAATRVGEVSRTEEWWHHAHFPASFERGAKSFTAVHVAPDGTPDAVARYAVDQRTSDGLAASTLRVLEMHATGAEAEAALWEYLFGIDLVAEIDAIDRPVDDPLRWRLPDPRRMRVGQLRDHVWVRVLDVATALSARTYGSDDALVLELVDEFRPAQSGRWRIEGGPGGATCAVTGADPDLRLTATELGALYLGGVAASTLAEAGRVTEQTSGALRRADRFFGVQPLPRCTTHF